MHDSNRFRLVAVLTAVAMTSSCGTTRPTQRDDLAERLGNGTEEIIAYTTIDGERHPFQGTADVTKDELILYPRPVDRSTKGSTTRGDSKASPPVIHLPLDQVSLVEIYYANVAGTVAVVVITVLVVLAVAAAIALASKGSCPFIYSFDGEQYVFDGEPYGGAVTRSLARTDWSELEHLRAVGGEYRLLLTNEVDETQYTDSLALWIVDHRPDERAVVDAEGRTQLFRRVESPVSARDETGGDLLPFIRAVDGVSWTPELSALTKRLPLADVRNHVTLEFRRPAGTKRVWLLSNVATGPWGSTQLRTMLGMRGTAVQDWVRALDANPEMQRQLQLWNDREELFHLGVEVQVGDRWERRAVLLGGGPFISETRAVSLDLSGVEGETVRLRVHPPISFWRFEAFELAWEERAATPKVLAARVARDEHGADVRNLLRGDDGATLDQPEVGAITQLVFDAPPLSPGAVRTVFARTHGWYDVHLHELGEPETANLARLANEPGYAVRRALEDLVEFRRTGRLPYTMPRPAVANAPTRGVGP
jgi:hypothetical protein